MVTVHLRGLLVFTSSPQFDLKQNTGRVLCLVPLLNLIHATHIAVDILLRVPIFRATYPSPGLAVNLVELMWIGGLYIRIPMPGGSSPFSCQWDGAHQAVQPSDPTYTALVYFIYVHEQKTVHETDDPD